MKDDYTLYSEEEYIEKKQLLNSYSATAKECIWEEIVKYRNLFKYQVPFCEQNFYVTLNTTLMMKMIRIYEMQDCKQERNLAIELFCKTHHRMEQKDTILTFMQMKHLPIEAKLLNFLCSEELLLIKIFIILKKQVHEDILFLVLYLNEHSSWYPHAKSWIHFIGRKEDRDLTYEFRDFLDHLYRKLSINMVSLKIDKTATKEELSLHYPMCNKKQLEFYYEHSHSNCYYTIAHYMEYHHTSYETARKAMELLENMNFYEKVKVGKKYVYKVLQE